MENKCDILFVYPRTSWNDTEMTVAENDAPPLGLLYIASAARQSGLNVSVIDMNHPKTTNTELISNIYRTKPYIVAFSVLSTVASYVKEIAEEIKNTFPSIFIIAGGIHPTVQPFEMLSSKIDYIVLGEGENTIGELAIRLIEGKNVNDISGIAFLEKKNCKQSSDSNLTHTLIKNGNSLSIKNLDILPLPARDLVPIIDYGQSGAICTTRGCPHACSFCSSVLISSHQYRRRSVVNVIDEMDHINKKYGIDRFQFIDDNFACDTNHASSISKFLLNRQYIWSCQTSVMEFASDLGTLDLMYESGCREIYFGLESGSERILKNYKGIDLDTAIYILEYAVNIPKKVKTRNRLQIVVGFIIGHPEDDEQSIEDTIQTAIKLRTLGIDTMLSILQPYPGSMIHKCSGNYGITIENSNLNDYLYPQSNISTKLLSRKKIKELYASGLYRIIKTYN